jgi:hypothetical protein
MPDPRGSLEATVALIQAFIVRNRGPLREPLSPDTELLRRGLVSSLELARLAREIADAFGVTIARGGIVISDFETPRSVWQCFDRLR